MLTASLISTCIGMHLPGPGAIYLGQTLRFPNPVYPGDTVTATATITHIRDDKPVFTIETVCTNQRGERVVEGEAHIMMMKPGEMPD